MHCLAFMSSPRFYLSLPMVGADDTTSANGLSLTDALGLVAQGFLLGHIKNPELDIQQLDKVLK